MQDLIFGIRVLAKRRGFTLIAIATLALGIGANTAVFTVVNAVLLRPLPYPEPDRIMTLGPDWGATFQGVSEFKYVFWRDHNNAFENVAASQSIGSGVNLSGGDQPEFVPGMKTSAGFFEVLGINPFIGRGFTIEEDSPGGESVAVLSDGLWRRRFGGDSAIVGRQVSINGLSHTVVGVLPADFRFSFPVDVIVPMRTNPTSRDEGHNYQVFARLKPGITGQQAVDDMRLVFEKFKAEHPKLVWRREQGIRVEPYLSAITAGARPLLFILLGAVGLVLLIACANVANLQLAHAASRRKEIAVRIALGAGSWRIVRQLLTEGLLLALAGGLAGLLLAFWLVRALAALIPENLIPRAAEIGFDWRVLIFTMAASILTGLLFAVAPVLRSLRVDLNDTLKEGAGKGTAGTDGGWLRKAIVTAEVSLALVLLIGAALLVRTFANLLEVEPGFDPRNVLTFEVAPNGPQFETTAAQAEYLRRGLEQIKSLPGVESAAVTSNLPLSLYLNLTVEIEGRPNSERSTEYRFVTPEYFRVMKMKLRHGREFADSDTAGSEPVVIINDAYARLHFPESDPLEHQLIVQRVDAGARSSQIIGIVNDIKQFGLGFASPPTVFALLPQVPDSVMRTARKYVTMKFAVRTTVEPLSLSVAARQKVQGVDSSLPVTNIRSLEQIVSGSVEGERFNMTVLGVFAAIGLMLAAVGIYGVISYSVAQRTHEIGIRVALGARRRDVLKLMVGEGLVLSLIGVGVGLMGAYGLTRLISSFLFGVTAVDPVTFATVSVLLTAVALLASYIPARRAMKMDPLIALRYE